MGIRRDLVFVFNEIFKRLEKVEKTAKRAMEWCSSNTDDLRKAEEEIFAAIERTNRRLDHHRKDLDKLKEQAKRLPKEVLLAKCSNCEFVQIHSVGPGCYRHEDGRAWWSTRLNERCPKHEWAKGV